MLTKISSPRSKNLVPFYAFWRGQTYSLTEIRSMSAVQRSGEVTQNIDRRRARATAFHSYFAHGSVYHRTKMLMVSNERWEKSPSPEREKCDNPSAHKKILTVQIFTNLQIFDFLKVIQIKIQKEPKNLKPTTLALSTAFKQDQENENRARSGRDIAGVRPAQRVNAHRCAVLTARCAPRRSTQIDLTGAFFNAQKW